MSNVTVIETAGDPVVIDLDEDTVVVAFGAEAPCVVQVEEDSITVELSEAPVVCVEVGLQGPAGPQGPEGPQGPPGVGVPLTEVREDELLVGTIDGANTIFSLPNGERAFHADPGVKVRVYFNGQRLNEGLANDFIVIESGGVGTGVDMIQLSFAPIPPPPGRPTQDKVTADYIVIP